MVFSVAALVAFSFAGMANNEVKEVEKNEDLLKCRPCIAILLEAHDGFVNLVGMDDATAWESAFLIYQDYIDNGRCDCA